MIIASDASSCGIGACIMHKLKDGSIKPTEHAFKTLLPTEENYSVIEMESLGIVFLRFLDGRRFTFQTDHRPLLATLGSKKNLLIYTANSLQRWETILLNYDFRILFLTSSKSCHADGLSRLIPPNSEPLEDTVIASLQTKVEIKKTLCNIGQELPVTLKEIQKKCWMTILL